MDKKISYYHLFFVLIFSITSFSVYSKDRPDDLFKEMRQKYPDQNAIFLQHSRHVLIDIVDDSLKVTAQQHYDILHLSDHTDLYAEEAIHSSHFAQVTAIDAKTLVPGKRKYKEISVENFTRKSEVSSGIFYDDSESINFTFPAVQRGVRTQLDYQLAFTEPTFLNAFHFASYLPVQQSQLVLKVHESVTINFKFFNLDSLSVKQSISDEEGYKIYKFTVNEINQIERESNAPAISYFSPHLVYFIKQATIKGQVKKYLDTPADLYKLYQKYIAGINNEKEDSTVVSLLDSLLYDTDSELDKVKKIYNWVQDNIKYVAFENGMRGLIPHNGSLVCQKRYGDCKDMASILHWMMKLAGIQSHLTWIGSRDLPYKYTDLPTPQVDNHMITTYYDQDEPVFLDATGKFATLQYPTSMIQGKEALVAIDEQQFKIEKVPVIPAKRNQLYDSVSYELQDETIVGKGHVFMTGYQKVMQTYLLENINEEDKEKALTGVLEKGNNKFNIEDFEIYNQKHKEKPLSITYNFTLPDYINQLDDEVYINLNLDKSLINESLDLDKRKLPIEFEFLYQDKHVSVFSLPQGSTASFVPDPVAFDHEAFGFEIKYEVTAEYIKQYKEIYVNTLLLKKEDFANWNKMINQLNDAYREAIILKINSSKF